jgi:hypothetical protein
VIVHFVTESGAPVYGEFVRMEIATAAGLSKVWTMDTYCHNHGEWFRHPSPQAWTFQKCQVGAEHPI